MQIATTWPRTASPLRAEGPARAEGLVGAQWTQIGPAPIRVDSDPNKLWSGEVTDIAIDPRNSTDQVIYIAINNGGVWKTTDGGTTWKPKTDYLPGLSMGAVALDPSNPSVVYAGTGNNYDGAGLAFKAVGLYKSVDMGETWTVLNPGGIFSGNGINRIAVTPGGVLLVATGGGLYRSINGGLSFGNNSPTFNNGSPVRGGFVADLKVDTTAATTAYIAIAGSGIFKSVDSGATWGANSPLFNDGNPIFAPGVTFGLLTFAQSTQPNNQTLYANVADGTGFRAGYVGLFRSTNGGATWTQRSATGLGSCWCGYDLMTGVDPQNANHVYLGMIGIWSSTDGGANFSDADAAGIVHDDNHAMAFSPATHWGSPPAPPTRIYTGNDGGFATSANGTTWENRNNGLATLLMDGIDIGRGSSANNAYTYGGLQDNGNIVRRAGFPALEFHLNTCCDGGRVAVDWTNPQRAYSAGNGGYMRTTDGGDTWPTPAGHGLPSAYLFGVDPNNGSVVYATASAAGDSFNPGPALYQSTNGGDTFTRIITFPAAIRSLAFTKQDSNVMWVSLDNGTVQRTANALAGGSMTWTPLTVSGAPAGQRAMRVAIDPLNSQQVVVVYSGFTGINPVNRTKHVFRTTDNGETWADISGTDGADPLRNLPDLPLNTVVIDSSTSPHTIVVGSDSGIMRTANNGATWEVLGLGMPTVDILSLALDYTVSPPLLRAGTYGRSVFELTLSSGPLLAVNTDLSFGGVPSGTATSRIVQVFNTGSADLHVSSLARAAGSTAFQLIGGPPTPVTIPAGHELDFTIRFLPTGAGPLTATFQIDSDDPFTPAYLLSASGTGLAPRIVVVGDLNFGVVARGTTATRNVTIYNTGGAPLTVSSVAFDGGSDPSFSVLGPTTPQTIAAGSSLAFTIQFAPPAASPPGTRTGTLRINSDDPATPSVTVPASGNVGAPHFTVSSTALQFGTVPVDDRTNPHTSDQTLRLTNQSSCAGCDLKLLSLPIGGPDAGDFTLVAPPSLPATIAAGNSLDLSVRFNPSDDGGRNATLTVNTDDPTSPTVTVSLSGTGIIPAITALPNPLIFGPTVYDPICDPMCGATLNEAVTNNGQAELILDTLSISDSTMFTTPVAIMPPLRVQPTDSDNLPVTFHPTGGAARMVTGTLYITDTLGPAPTASPAVAAIPVCGESVGRGIRVIVYDNNGNLVPVADSIKLQSHGLTQPVNEQVANAPLTTIDPPASCQRIQFHYENQNLQATDVAGNRGSFYILTVDVGNKHLTLSFTLEVNEFKTIIATVQ